MMQQKRDEEEEEKVKIRKWALNRLLAPKTKNSPPTSCVVHCCLPRFQSVKNAVSDHEKLIFGTSRSDLLPGFRRLYHTPCTHYS